MRSSSALRTLDFASQETWWSSRSVESPKSAERTKTAFDAGASNEGEVFVKERSCLGRIGDLRGGLQRIGVGLLAGKSSIGVAGHARSSSGALIGRLCRLPGDLEFNRAPRGKHDVVLVGPEGVRAFRFQHPDDLQRRIVHPHRLTDGGAFAEEFAGQRLPDEANPGHTASFLWCEGAALGDAPIPNRKKIGSRAVDVKRHPVLSASDDLSASILSSETAWLSGQARLFLSRQRTLLETNLS